MLNFSVFNTLFPRKDNKNYYVSTDICGGIYYYLANDRIVLTMEQAAKFESREEAQELIERYKRENT